MAKKLLPTHLDDNDIRNISIIAAGFLAAYPPNATTLPHPGDVATVATNVYLEILKLIAT